MNPFIGWNYFKRSLNQVKKEIEILMKEGNELLAIVVASIKTARKNSNKQN
jgi:hypothetical protein